MPPTATEEVDLTTYATKKPTAMQEAFAEWLKEETTYDPATAKSKDEAFRMGVALGAYLRPTYQSSDANRSARKERRDAKATDETAEERPAKPAKAKAKAAPAPAPTKTAAPAKRGGPRKAAARPATDSDGNSPF